MKNPAHPLTARRIEAIKAALANGPMNSHELAKAICLCVRGVRDYMTLMIELELAHVCQHKFRAESNNHRIPVYALGKRKSAKKPPPLTTQKKRADYMVRVRADKDRLDLHLARNRAAKAVKRAVKKPNSWLNILGAP